jgi:aspartyl-tRNA(Asn)/glutamyl-tRNA(Gln) amidotransferase subunit C
MPLTPDEVRKVGTLARLALSDDEVDRLTHQLNDLLDQFARLQQLPTESVPPTSHAVPIQAFLREDRITPSLPREEVLALTSHVDDYLGGFVVPQVIEE